ncbi:MAG: GNAT family N-acetyltransferase [Anaerolineaceae bacterium]|nr:GNAT family N-acetyltransferase [Anaerolineaceae bacterium]
MALATWWQGDDIPLLSPITNFDARPSDDAVLLARLAKLDVENVQTRLCEGHVPYIAWLDDMPVAYGWVATQTAHIGELDLHITLSVRSRYLWDFATLPDWRGRGIYPHLLQAILTAESSDAEQFWIIAAPENRASGVGIAKAGFQNVANLSFQHEGEARLIPVGNRERIDEAQSLLQTPLLDTDDLTAPCWHCVMDAQKTEAALTDISCWENPSVEYLALSDCDCSQAAKPSQSTYVRVLF